MEQLRTYCRELSIELTDRQLEQFQFYYELLIEWNEKINLTAITEYDEVLKKHFLDSLSLVKAAEVDVISMMINSEDYSLSRNLDKKVFSDPKPDCKNTDFHIIKLLDIGTGAGFPSIPLKIVFPQISVVMLDSLNKRINFLNEVISKLELSDITALHGRAEDFAKSIVGQQNMKAGNNSLSAKSYGCNQENIIGREYFDLVVSRAVANLSTLSEYCLPYVKKEGIFVAYKSEEIAKEREAAEHAIGILGGKIEKTYDFVLPCTEYHRSLCVVRKVKPTPKKYPRKAGLPAKEPIK